MSVGVRRGVLVGVSNAESFVSDLVNVSDRAVPEPRLRDGEAVPASPLNAWELLSAESATELAGV